MMSVTQWIIGLGCLSLGLVSWTFFEYALHHWVGHLGKGKNEFSREHLRHHSKKDYFAPMWKKVPALLLILSPVAYVLSFAVGGLIATSYISGVGIGYLVYEGLHRRLHTHAPLNGYGRWARKHHFYHHLVDARVNHGVTTPLWDKVFGTYTAPSQIKVHPKLAMDWLCDLETSEVRPEHAADYRLS